MMNDKDYRIFSLFASLVQQRFPDSRIWAFGSRIKGRFIEDSDLDVCVVVDKLDDTVWISHGKLVLSMIYSSQPLPIRSKNLKEVPALRVPRSKTS